MNTYCLKCKKETSNIDPKMVKTKNNRLLMQSKCSVCKTKKSRFVKEQDAKGLLSNLGIKTPLSKIPLLNVLFSVCKMNDIINKFLLVGQRKPNKIWVDQDSELYNNTFKYFLKINNIEMYSTFNEGKSVVAERFIRTLKNKFFKHMTAISKMFILTC